MNEPTHADVIAATEPTSDEVKRATLEQTGASIATSADLARAISLRGVFAVCGVACVEMQDTGARSIDDFDDFNKPWEQLASNVQSSWLTLASYVDKLAHTPGWSGTLGGPT